MNQEPLEIKLYESPALRQVMGDTLRPGGFSLTERALQFCTFPAGGKILDVGCGNGATVEYLRRNFNLEAVGVDPSSIQLELGKQRNPSLSLVLGVGENLPFTSEEMDGVLAECTFSLMKDLKAAIEEIYRVLKVGGRLVINDVYARNQEGVAEIRAMGVSTCLRGAMLKEELIDLLKDQGFKILLWEDHTGTLTQLMGQMIFTYGSMENFWLKSTNCLVDPVAIQQSLRLAKIGYCQLIARK
jgi:arsenite methyltransferase